MMIIGFILFAKISKYTVGPVMLESSLAKKTNLITHYDQEMIVIWQPKKNRQERNVINQPDKRPNYPD